MNQQNIKDIFEFFASNIDNHEYTIEDLYDLHKNQQEHSIKNKDIFSYPSFVFMNQFFNYLAFSLNNEKTEQLFGFTIGKNPSIIYRNEFDIKYEELRKTISLIGAICSKEKIDIDNNINVEESLNSIQTEIQQYFNTYLLKYDNKTEVVDKLKEIFNFVEKENIELDLGVDKYLNSLKENNFNKYQEIISSITMEDIEVGYSMFLHKREFLDNDNVFKIEKEKFLSSQHNDLKTSLLDSIDNYLVNKKYKNIEVKNKI